MMDSMNIFVSLLRQSFNRVRSSRINSCALVSACLLAYTTTANNGTINKIDQWCEFATVTG